VKEGSTLTRLKVGVVGCGLIAQVMHLPYLRELGDRFEVVAVCDLSDEALGFARDAFPAAKAFRGWEELVAEPLDAVMVLTAGSHAPIAVAAAEAGKHVFVEKPMCLAVEEGREMIAAADRAGVRLMVGYMKRYDPAYERLAEEVAGWDAVRLVRVTTLESPLEPYVGHYPLRRAPDIDPETLAELLEDDDRRVTAAIGTDDPVLRRAYRAVLLDSMVHELNAVRGLLGEPSELRFADVWGEPDGIAATFSFGSAECVCLWVDLPGIARYEQEIALYASGRRASLVFSSPFLRSMPTQLVLEGGEPGSAASWETVHTVTYEEAFKRELVEFHAAVVEGREPRTSGLDGLRDVALCQAIVRSYLDCRPIPSPTVVEERESRALH
jgi:predicted dehydrogenase